MTKQSILRFRIIVNDLFIANLAWIAAPSLRAKRGNRNDKKTATEVAVLSLLLLI